MQITLRLGDVIVFRGDGPAGVPYDTTVDIDTVLLGPDMDPEEEDEEGSVARVTFGTNQVSVLEIEWSHLEWWYAYVEHREPLDGDDGFMYDSLLDCIGFLWFEGKAPSFDGFYPEGVDGRDGPSVDHVYRDTLDETNDSDDLARLDDARVDAHIAAVEDLHSDGRCVLRFRGTTDEMDLFEEGQWYVIGLRDPGGAGEPGLAATRYPYPNVFFDDGAVPTLIEKVFAPDPGTRRRLTRVVSLDFVRDIDITPPDTVPGDPEPILVLFPSANEWTVDSWPELVLDLKPVVWDEETGEVDVLAPEEAGQAAFRETEFATSPLSPSRDGPEPSTPEPPDRAAMTDEGGAGDGGWSTDSEPEAAAPRSPFSPVTFPMRTGLSLADLADMRLLPNADAMASPTRIRVVE